MIIIFVVVFFHYCGGYCNVVFGMNFLSLNITTIHGFLTRFFNIIHKMTSVNKTTLSILTS